MCEFRMVSYAFLKNRLTYFLYITSCYQPLLSHRSIYLQRLASFFKLPKRPSDYDRGSVLPRERLSTWVPAELNEIPD